MPKRVRRKTKRIKTKRRKTKRIKTKRIKTKRIKTKRRKTMHGGANAPQNYNSDVLSILVAAHDRDFNDGAEIGTFHFVEDLSPSQFVKAGAPHWQKSLIETEIRRRYEDKPYHIVTMDSSIKECCLPNGGGEYPPSVYDGHYIVANKDKFDMVFVPDIGVIDQSHFITKILEKTATEEEIRKFINGCLELVKPGGYLYIGKSFTLYEKGDPLLSIIGPYDIEELEWRPGHPTVKYLIINKPYITI